MVDPSRKRGHAERLMSRLVPEKRRGGGSDGKRLLEADATMTLSRETLDRILLAETTPDKEIEVGSIRLQGNRRKLSELLSLLDTFEPMFNIVIP